MFEDGKTISFTDYICDDGVGNGPYELKLSLTRTGEKVHLDFTGSAPQAAGPVNYYLNENLARMFFGIYMITVADPQILWNDGFYPLVDVRIPEGSFWKPRHPAALNGRNHGIGRVFDLFGGLLGQTNPALLNAAGFSSSPHFMYSGHYTTGDREGEWFQLYSIGFGGIPGRPLGDGPDGHSLWPSFVNIPCEYLESYYPLRIEKWETVADTGGAGLHRGGNGVDVAYRFLEAGHDRHPRRPLAHLPVGRERRRARRARHASGSSAPTARGRCCRASATTCRSRPVTCCTSSPGAAAAGATRWSATPSSSPWRCAAGWSPPRAPAGTGWWCDGAARSTRRPRRAAGASCAPAGRPSCRCSTWARRSRTILARCEAETGLPAPHRAGLDVTAATRRSAARSAGARGPALLVIDLVRAYFTPGSPLDPAPGVLDAAARCWPRPAPPACRCCTPGCAYAAGVTDGGLFVRKVPALRRFAEDDPLGRARARGRPMPGEVVVVKQYASAFFGTSLAATLTASGMDTA